MTGDSVHLGTRTELSRSMRDKLGSQSAVYLGSILNSTVFQKSICNRSAKFHYSSKLSAYFNSHLLSVAM